MLFVQNKKKEVMNEECSSGGRQATSRLLHLTWQVGQKLLYTMDTWKEDILHKRIISQPQGRLSHRARTETQIKHMGEEGQ